MERHLYNVILRRISNGIRRTAKRSGVLLDALDPDEAVMLGRGGELEASLGRAQVTQQLHRVVRERAAGDPEVAWTGLILPEVVNARRRLDRLLAALPDELRFAALATMRETDIVQVSETTGERNG